MATPGTLFRNKRGNCLPAPQHSYDPGTQHTAGCTCWITVAVWLDTADVFGTVVVVVTADVATTFSSSSSEDKMCTTSAEKNPINSFYLCTFARKLLETENVGFSWSNFSQIFLG